ncbi:hypothetical protein BUALT_Bualt12G0033800 [Buddleja alternifolia]|uniref:Pentatricopeptide repeat-containing protein n=1 Tax=Buddleja alternifolia TaxID=168488 RepID=A0AAV6WWE1_9LAMI|nr:hypothetical protein BUALT_Bualt12G0033800 [Buddleja alternifolia]
MPDEATFSPLLKGLFRENRIVEVQELFRKIVREGLCEVDNIIFGVVIDGLCKAGIILKKCMEANAGRIPMAKNLIICSLVSTVL